MSEKQKTASSNRMTIVGTYIDMAIRASGKTKRKVAEEAGYKRPNIISMLCAGEIDLSFSKVIPVANAIEVDASSLLFMLIKEKHPDLHNLLNTLLSDRLFSADEAQLVDIMRSITGTTSLAPKLPEEFEALRAYCALIKKREGSISPEEAVVALEKKKQELMSNESDAE